MRPDKKPLSRRQNARGAIGVIFGGRKRRKKRAGFLRRLLGRSRLWRFLWH